VALARNKAKSIKSAWTSESESLVDVSKDSHMTLADIAKLLKFLLDRSPITVKKNNFYVDFIMGLSLDW